MEAEEDAERLLRRTEKRAFAAFKISLNVQPCKILAATVPVKVNPDKKSNVALSVVAVKNLAAYRDDGADSFAWMLVDEDVMRASDSWAGLVTDLFLFDNGHAFRCTTRGSRRGGDDGISPSRNDKGKILALVDEDEMEEDIGVTDDDEGDGDVLGFDDGDLGDI
ncbi:UPF0426 protein [Hibiscus syriacus]|uniref:UPF0426 protein n=1 Tax=Hibiscus syriacus TaxID=106335 RepID=A0A6A3BYE5_HIBSY|nr:UPF0426 protein [Hibiscus syriacus]